jgi:hypothetical protein
VACSPKKRPATWATDAPLETAGDHWEPPGSDGMWTKRGPRLARRQGGPILPGRGRLRRFGPPRRGTDFGPDRLAGHGKANHGLDRRSPACKARSGRIVTCDGRGTAQVKVALVLTVVVRLGPTMTAANGTVVARPSVDDANGAP